MHWIARVEGSPRRIDAAAVVVRDSIYSFGGLYLDDDYTQYHPIDVHVVNTKTFCWTSLMHPKYNKGIRYPEVPYKRYGHTAVLYKEMVYIWGGRNDVRPCNTLFAFNTNTFLWEKPTVHGSVPSFRNGHTACVVGDCMYVFGGCLQQINIYSRDVHCLNLETMTWSYVETSGETPSQRDLHTATVIGDSIYVFGGRGNGPVDDFYCNSIMYLDVKTFKWHKPNTSGRVPAGRASHCAFVYNGKIVIFGGYQKRLDLPFNELNCFDSKTNAWSLLRAKGQKPEDRHRQVCLVVGNRMFMFGGMTYAKLFRWSNIPIQFQNCDTMDMVVLDFEPSLETLAMIAAIQAKLDTSALPNILKSKIKALINTTKITETPECWEYT